MGKETDRFVQSFWYWNKFSNYLLCLFVIVCIVSLVTALFKDDHMFILIIGVLSSGIEVSSLPYLLIHLVYVVGTRHSSALVELLAKAHVRTLCDHGRHVAFRRHV